MRRAWIALVVGFALLPSGVAHAWFGPFETFAPGGDFADVATSPNGRAIVGWGNFYGGGAWAVTRAPGAGFGRPERLAPQGRIVQVAIGEDGTAAALVLVGHRLHLSVRDGEGPFSEAELLPHPDAHWGEVLVEPGGRISVAWAADGRGYLMEREPESEPEVVLDFPAGGGGHPSGPLLARDLDGDSWLAWFGWVDDGWDPVVMVSERPAGGSFGEPEVVSDDSAANQMENLALDSGADDTAVVLWYGYDWEYTDVPSVVGTATARGGSWRRPVEQFFDPSRMWFGAVAPSGRAAVIAPEQVAPPRGAVAGPGETVGELQPMAEPVPPVQDYWVNGNTTGWGPRSPELMELGMDADGRMISVWAEHEDPGASMNGRAIGWLERTDGAWCAVTEVGPTMAWRRLAFDAVGGGVMAWVDGGALHVASYTADDTCPPPLYPPADPPPPEPGPDSAPPVADLPPPAANPPEGVGRLRIARVARATRNRRFSRVRLTCAGAAPCSGSLVSARTGARKRFALPPRRARNVRIALDRGSRRALRRRRAVRLPLAARLRGGHELRRTVRVLRAARARRRSPR